MLNFMIMMNTDNKNTNLLGVTLIICVLSSCIPIIDSRVDAIFKNSTNDTLFIGASHYDNLDSVEFLVNPNYTIPANSNLDTTDNTEMSRRTVRLKRGACHSRHSFILKG